VWQRQHPAKV